MYENLEDIPFQLLSRQGQAALGSLMGKVRRLRTVQGAQLFFVYLPGCGACASAKPTVRAFARKHKNIKVTPKSLATLKLTDAELSQVVTPTYVLKTPDGKYHKIEGAITRLLELEAEVFHHLGRYCK